MDKKRFGKNGPLVSEIGMGTYYDVSWIILSRLGIMRNKAKKIEAIKTGLIGGMNLIDTAEIYGSEPLVAEAIKEFNREEIFISTKVWPSHLSRDKFFKSLEGSLRRLNTKYVDLYLIHFPNKRVPISETMKAMEEAIEQGKILFVGVSNFNLKQIEEARNALSKHDITAVQLEYSLIKRDVERDILPYCQREGIAFMAYYPLGHGRLAKEKEKLEEISMKYGKTPSQIALRWLADKPYVFPIPRASNPIHVQENLEASGWKLSDEDIKLLDKLFPLSSY
ncbi:MAG: aldo/keto reductase [Thermoproteota archaeon]|jgi:diketogulonate reductase-like aldo/keto reductase|nr:aldo/keto reductase [Thermoproteota archaeon]